MSYIKHDKHAIPLRFLIFLVFLTAPSYGEFVHPGLLYTQNNFNRMAQKVSANTQPWIGSWNLLTASNNSYANTFYTPNIQSYVNRGSGCANQNYVNLMYGTAGAYQLALR
jgi:hypothetical protein